MPLTRAWAGDARIFTRYHSATSSTQPTHATLFTGLHPWEHGMSGNTMIFPEHPASVPQILEEAGFETTAVVASLPVSGILGFSRGFGRFDDTFDAGRIPTTWQQVSGRDHGPYYSLADAVGARARAELARTSGDRQFLWFHFYDPHAPYGELTDAEPVWPQHTVERVVARESDRGGAVAVARRLYDRDVALLDRELHTLLLAIDEERDRFETHVLIVSDHGESFGEDDSMAHGKRLTAPQIRVPLVLRSPRIDPGIDRRIAGTVDLAPTLLDLASLHDGSRLLDERAGGRSLLEPPTGNEVASGMRRTFTEPFRELRLDGSTYVHDHELFYLVDRDGHWIRGNGRFLFDPMTELGEPSYEPSVGARAQRAFRGFEEQLARTRLDGMQEGATLDALESLGYVN